MDITQVLRSAADGDPRARAEVIQAAYENLRAIAAKKMASERENHTLTATALVHEVAIKFLDETRVPPTNRNAFFGYAARAMRNLLVDHARSKGRQKRGGQHKKLSFDEAFVAAEEQRDEFLALNDALEELAAHDPRKASVVELRYFGGFSNQETADTLGTSLATVKRDWEVAKTWLMHELQNRDSE